MFKSINDLFSASKNVIIERIKSPLLSSFGIAWLFFNWKIVLLLLFSNKGIEDKIKDIDQLTNILNGFWFPCAIATFYTVAYPLINYWVFKAHNGFEKQAEILRTLNAIDVLDRKIEQANKENQLERSKFNAQYRLELDKMNNEHELADKKLGIEKLRLEKEMLELRRSLSSQTASNGS
jgi:hypothetical protein